MAVAFVALLVALSGTASALQGKNTVDSGDIKNGAVKTKDIASNAVTAKKVKDGSLASAEIENGGLTGTDVADNGLAGSDIDESTLGQVPSANSANSANTATTATTANTATRAGSAGSVDSLQTYSKKATPTPGADFDAAQAAAPEIPLAERGAFEVYGKCFKDTTTGVVFSLTYIRTSVDGSILDSPDNRYTGDPFLLDGATPEYDRRIQSTDASSVGGGAYQGGPGDTWSAMAPGGSAVTGLAGNGAKEGDLPGGNGIYGPGDVCLFSGYLAG